MRRLSRDPGRPPHPSSQAPALTTRTAPRYRVRLASLRAGNHREADAAVPVGVAGVARGQRLSTLILPERAAAPSAS
jgi:hypothetical protein